MAQDSRGNWDLERFVIDDFYVLKTSDIEQTVADLRAVKAKWKSLGDPLGTLDAIRSGED